ncbi:hypothetical protein HDU93_002923 [Gonapodya sp. JEL0774]|nr:hypothetical protein HDU93_002923 [Gonapodya sp. JEL0774]
MSRSGSIRSMVSVADSSLGDDAAAAAVQADMSQLSISTKPSSGYSQSLPLSLETPPSPISSSAPHLRRPSISKGDSVRGRKSWHSSQVLGGGPKAPDVKAERVKKWDKEVRLGRMKKVMKERRREFGFVWSNIDLNWVVLIPHFLFAILKVCTLGLQNPRQNLGNLLFLTDTLDPDLDQEEDQTTYLSSPWFTQPVPIPTKLEPASMDPPLPAAGVKGFKRHAITQFEKGGKAQTGGGPTTTAVSTPSAVRRAKIHASSPYPIGAARIVRRLAAAAYSAVAGKSASSDGDTRDASTTNLSSTNLSSPSYASSTVTTVTIRTPEDVAIHKDLLKRAAGLMRIEMLKRDLDVGDAEDLEQRIVEDGFMLDVVVLSTPMTEAEMAVAASVVETATANGEVAPFAITPNPPHREEPIAVCERTFMRGFLFVQYLCVHSAWQGRGLGSWMLARLTEAARSRTRRGVMLVSVKETLGFYGREGFEQVTSAGIEWTGGDRLMVLDLQAKSGLGLAEELGRGSWGVQAPIVVGKGGAGRT